MLQCFYMSDRFSGQKVLITGAAGFLGSHLVETLLKEGAIVLGVDNFITGNADNLAEIDTDRFAFVEADVTQPAGNYLHGEVFDYIFHFASPASPPWYQKYPRETYLVNTVATDHLLKYLQATNPAGRFIFAGTSEAYGDPLEHPQKETYWGNVNPNGVRSCYDESKRLGETITGVFYRNFGLDTRIVRIFNTYGPRIGVDDGRVIPSFIMSALKNQPMRVFGDGSQTRSYCYVSDLIEGILRLATVLEAEGQTVNLGNPVEYTVRETAEIIWQAVYEQVSSAKIEFQELPGDDPTRRKPDISKAKELLGWEPKVSFTEGLRKTVEWFAR